MLRKTPIASGLIALLSTFPAADSHAQAQNSAAPEAQPQTLAEITVSATRSERKVDTVPNTVSVYTRSRLMERDPRDLKDMLAGEVDLAVRALAPRFTAAGASTGRAGNEGINIRGLEGNQVLIMVDGIRVPQAFSFGAFASGRLGGLEMDSLASAEVLRGPASTQFGSDGLAGALTLRTLAPEDLLVGGKTRAGFVSSSLLSVDQSIKLSGAVAAAAGDWQGLLLYTARRGHELGNKGDNQAENANRTAPNPADIRSGNLLAKLGLRLSPQQRLLATLEARQSKTDTNVLSARAVTVSALTPRAVVDLQAQDEVQRQRFSLAHEYEDLNASWLHSLKTQVYAQASETRQDAAEDRFIAADRTRKGFYKERLIGLSATAQTQLAGQRLSYGLDLSRNRISGLRDGTVPPPGETFPAKAFPDTDYTLAGAFVQDEIEAGNFSLIPALRFEHYSLTPKQDGYTGKIVSLSGQALTPRLGLVWRLAPQFQPYGQWALGFRAPAPDQVNNGFSNPAQGYTSIGNPDLKPEHANSLELGLRGQLIETLRWQLSAYHNRYRDFIKQEVVSGTGKPQDPLIFQSINLSQAQIEGLEARLMWQPLAGLNLSGAWALSRGHSTVAGVDTPLDTVQPQRLSLAARYDVADWSLQLSWQHSQGKKASAASSPELFLPPSFNVIDIGASLRLNPTWRVAAFVTNLGDSKYWRWSDLRDVKANDTTLDAHTAPGRALQLSLRADF